LSIAIVDYGAGNLRSVQKALEKLGFDAVLTSDKSAIAGAKGVILPGVGAFDAALLELRKKSLEGSIVESIARGKPYLGICLGYQLLFPTSEEGRERGFAILEGAVRKFDFKGTAWEDELVIPQMGWNRLLIKHPSPLLDGIASGSMVYFAHSYYPDPADKSAVAAETDYGVTFASVLTKGNLHAVQFHPEKSGDVGMKILENFGKLCLLK